MWLKKHECKLGNLIWDRRPDTWVSRNQWNSSRHALEHFLHMLVQTLYAAQSSQGFHGFACEFTPFILWKEIQESRNHGCCIFHSVYITLLHFVNIEPLTARKNELEIHGNAIAFFYSLQSLQCQSWRKRSHFNREPTLPRWAETSSSSWGKRSISGWRLIATIRVWWYRGGAWTSHLLFLTSTFYVFQGLWYL